MVPGGRQRPGTGSAGRKDGRRSPAGLPSRRFRIPSQVSGTGFRWTLQGRSGRRLVGRSLSQRGSSVLYSRQARIAFAHYPKTGGISLHLWFRKVLPDAELLVRDNPHLPVRTGLEMVAAESRAGRGSRWRAWRTAASAQEPRLVVGVLREPFAMLVSLFEYWRAYPFATEPAAAFIRCARTGTFAEFVHMAVVEGQLPTYESFFDVGGPAWSRTMLLDFGSLESGLRAVAARMRLRCRPSLDRHNEHRGTRDMAAYRAAAGPLAGDVRRYFRWYHETGLSLVGRLAPSAVA